MLSVHDFTLSCKREEDISVQKPSKKGSIGVEHKDWVLEDRV